LNGPIRNDGFFLFIVMKKFIIFLITWVAGNYYNEIEMLGVDKVYLSEDDDKKTKVFIIDGGDF
jgi:hypothetical protein